MDKAIIAIAGCKNSGKSSLCKFITFVIARAEGYISDDPLSGKFSCDNLVQLPKDDSKNNIYITKNGSFFKNAELSRKPSVEVDSFAKPIKEMCVDIFGINPESIYGNEDQKKSLTHYEWKNIPEHIRSSFEVSDESKISAREMMQMLGTDIFRNYFNNNIWVDALLRRVEKSSAEVIMVDDLRFNSEAEKLMKKNAMFIHLQRMWKQGGMHSSENGLDLNIFSGYPHYCSIPDLDIMAKNKMAFNAIREYFKYVVTVKNKLSK